MKENYIAKPDQDDPQQHWENIISSCMLAGKEILGEKTKAKKHEDKALEDLSKRQKELKNQADAFQVKQHHETDTQKNNNTRR
jgi:hypothetical protein